MTKESVKLDRSFTTVLIKYRELGSHVVIIPKLHLGELNTFFECTYIGYCTDQLDIYIYVFFFIFNNVISIIYFTVVLKSLLKIWLNTYSNGMI